jgi:hypothetical protein
MNTTFRRLFIPIFLLAVAGSFSGGCVSLSSMKPGKMEWIQASSTSPRAGNVYLIRGLIGAFSGGIDTLTVKIDQAGINAHVFQEDQKELIAQTLVNTYKNNPDHEPIILIGHSLGADDAIMAARELEKVGVPVDILVTIDATRPPKVPGNVKVCYNYYQPSVFDGTGILRGIPLETEPNFTGKLYNMNVRGEYKNLLEWDTNHVNIDKNNKIHADVLAKLMPVCMPREQWVASHTPVLAGSTTTRPAAPARTADASPALRAVAH